MDLTRFRLRHWAPLLALVYFVGPSTLPGQGSDTGEDRVVKYTQVQQPILFLKDTTFIVTYGAIESRFEKEEFGNTFALAEHSSKVSAQWKIGDRSVTLPDPTNGEVVSRPVSDTTVKFIPHEGIVYAKIESSDPVDAAGKEVLLTFSGTYEMTIVEGSWADYESGGTVVLSIAAKDRERYQGDCTGAFHNKEFLQWHAVNYKSRIVADFEQMAADPSKVPGGAPALASQRELVAGAAVTVTPKVEVAPEVFRLQGNELISTCERSRVSLLYQAYLPSNRSEATPANDQNWREKQGMVETRDFHLDDHKVGEEVDPWKGLPGRQWPGW